jgi:hypothetical protein
MTFLIFLVWTVCVVIGYSLGKERTIGTGGALLLSIFLGVIGVIIILCFPKKDEEEMKKLFYKVSVAKAIGTIDTDTMKDVMKNEDVATELKKWYDLKEMGAITAEEFEERKKALLSKS